MSEFPKSKIKIALCLPWYAGADRDCVVHFLQFQHYLGRLQERLTTIARRFRDLNIHTLQKLDPCNTTGFSEIPPELYGTEFEFGLVDEIGCSLPGVARERCIDNALTWGADFVLFYDADMIFGTDIFLRLFMAKKPIVGALAFTGRNPITPVIYTFHDYKLENNELHFHSEPIFDYKRDTLQQVDGIGAGVFLVDTAVFKALPKPWFATQSALGEDIYFCARAKMAGIEVWVDTAAKTLHKPTFPRQWHDELAYFQANPHLHTPQTEALAKEVNDLCEHVVKSGGEITEGSSTMPELLFLAEQASSLPRNARICEVGFNAGMSTIAMLYSNPTCRITSFDKGEWSCVGPAKEYIDKRYPGRHSLVLGDSKETLAHHTSGKYDLSFIDGGHDYETARSDVFALVPISKRVIMDDIGMPGVSKAWAEALKDLSVRPISTHEDNNVMGVPRRWTLAIGGAH